ncbi:MAG: tRNA uridine-5-carboxymethylaminomethyl(34) synthesis GTPase MnmE [Proteobacteria bacterium]|nr:tRNA uridine-5-carboxymethylaminomethyl(34) synthesis GTPase MnmE [Pseudomonadota bacterium]
MIPPGSKTSGPSAGHTRDDTIAAISTPPGPGAIGMIRVSGPDALSVVQKVFTPASPQKAPFPARKALFGRAHHPDRPSDPIDLGVLTYFNGPKTYTGEDLAEVTLHGGPLILHTFLQAVLRAGARLAEPGEFTRRAFLNGRMDLSQAEAVAGLIFSATDEARRVMLRQVEGAMGRQASSMRESLLESKVLLEASIDFPEEAEEGEQQRVRGLLGETRDQAARLLKTTRMGMALREGLRVVIAGAPNVGKSSLLNALLQEERAIVHETEGTTRDYIEGTLNVGGLPVKVVDTAGIRVSADALEQEGVRRTKGLMDRADAVLLVLDQSRPLYPQERTLLEEGGGAARVIVVNKEDLKIDPAFHAPPGAVKVSARQGTGIEDLKRAINAAFMGEGPDPDPEKGVVISLRQAEALEKVRDGCTGALEALRESGWPEVAVVGVDEALTALGQLVGEVTGEEVLEGIFSRFCIGK